MSLLNLSLSIAFRFLEIISLFKVVTGFFMLMSQVIRKWLRLLCLPHDGHLKRYYFLVQSPNREYALMHG